MHESLRLLEEVGTLRDPVLLCAFTGWTDAAGVSVATVEYLVEQWGGRRVAEIDPERFYDFTVQRPRVRLVEGQRVLDWPANDFYVASPPGADRDFLLFSGIEPHLRWRSFTEAITEMMRTAGASTSVTLGAQPGAVPHTRPLPVILSASDPGFAEQFRLEIPTSRYEGPTGIVGVLNLHFRSLQWRNASLWAVMPHYLNVGPNPNAIASLVRTVDTGFGTSTPQAALEARAEAFAEQVQEAMDRSSEALTYIRTLEEQYDAQRPTDEGSSELPSGAELLGDLERFLREQQQRGKGEGSA